MFTIYVKLGKSPIESSTKFVEALNTSHPTTSQFIEF